MSEIKEKGEIYALLLLSYTEDGVPILQACPPEETKGLGEMIERLPKGSEYDVYSVPMSVFKRELYKLFPDFEELVEKAQELAKARVMFNIAGSIYPFKDKVKEQIWKYGGYIRV